MAKSGGAQRGQRSEEAAADRQTCQSSQAKAGLSNGGETRKGGKDSRGVDESLYRHSTVSVASRVRQQKGGGKKIFLLLPFVSTPYPLFCLACECTLFSLFPRKKRRRGWGGEKLSPLPLNFFDAKISAKVEPFAPFLLLASLPPFFIPTTICEIRPLPPLRPRKEEGTVGEREDPYVILFSLPFLFARKCKLHLFSRGHKTFPYVGGEMNLIRLFSSHDRSFLLRRQEEGRRRLPVARSSKRRSPNGP